MVLALRVIGEEETTQSVYITPVVDAFPEEPDQTLAAFTHQTMAVMLDDLTQLMAHATDVYQSLYNELNDTAQRVTDLTVRVQAAADFMPALEDYIQQAGSDAFISRLGAHFATEKFENAQLLRPELRTKPLTVLYDASKPPPNLAIMDRFRAEEEGPSSLREYTNPNFFVEEWLREQLAKAKEAKNRRRQRDAKRGKSRGLRKDLTVTEVGKMKKTRYNKWGEKLEDGEEEEALPQPKKAVPPLTTASSTTALEASPRQPAAKAPVNKQRVAPGVGHNPLALDSPLNLTDKPTGGLDGSKTLGRVSPRGASPRATPNTKGTLTPAPKAGSSISKASSISQPKSPKKKSNSAEPLEVDIPATPQPPAGSPPEKAAEPAPAMVRAVMPTGARPSRGLLGAASHRGTLTIGSRGDEDTSTESDKTPRKESPRNPSSTQASSPETTPKSSAEPLGVAATEEKKKKKKPKTDGEKKTKKKGSKRTKAPSKETKPLKAPTIAAPTPATPPPAQKTVTQPPPPKGPPPAKASKLATPPVSPRGQGTGGLSPRARTSPRPPVGDAPAPPPPPMLIPDAPEEKRSDLLQQIQAGKNLRRVQQQQQQKAPRETHDDGSINVAAILQRRIALEYSDSEDDGDDGSDDSDWD